MNIEIPESVRREAYKCPHGIACLTTGRCGDGEMCRVDYAYGGKVLRLVSEPRHSCPYHVVFGRSPLCTCPVREYLHSSASFSVCCD